MSINKSQGQSVQHVGLDVRNGVFTHGQLYVAVSRATSVYNLKVIWDMLEISTSWAHLLFLYSICILTFIHCLLNLYLM